jgi:hypothetical protein
MSALMSSKLTNVSNFITTLYLKKKIFFSSDNTSYSYKKFYEIGKLNTEYILQVR